MTTLEEVAPQGWTRAPKSWWIVISCCLPLLPWCAVYLIQSWRNPTFQYIPFLLAFVVWFGWKYYEPGKATRGNWASIASAAVGMVCALLGAITNSPWFVWVGLIFVLALVAVRIRRRDDGSAAWPLWLLLWVSVRPPGSWSDVVILQLQNWSTTLASTFLHLLHIVHFRGGNVIELPGKRFMVEEACSGVQSLFTLIFIAAVIATLYRRSLLQAFGLFTGAIAWAIGLNALRILVVILAYSWYQWDWTSGWKHDAVGYVALTFAGLFLLSTDRLLHFLFGPLMEIEEEVQSGRELNPFAMFYNQWIAGSIAPLGTRVTPYFDPQLTAKIAEPKTGSLAVTCSIAILLCGLGLPTYWGYRGSPYAVLGKTEVTSDLQSLPESIALWRRVEYEHEKRTAESPFGEHSEIWTYQSAPLTARVSLDYYFSGWHDLVSCYQGIGWEIVERFEIEDQKTASGWNGVGVVLRDSTGRYGYLCYSLFEEEGAGMSPRSGRFWTRFKQLNNPPHTLQTQVFASLASPPDNDVKQKLESLHLDSRELLRNHFQMIRRGP